ncbi:MAG TPA: lipid-A-disaccharide synthase [Terriglobia bacterium]|nr:lipid-A-disaccharide synthase [Terriglobia bacterium]
MPKPSLMIVAGERSGDVYGGELAAALHARLDCDIFGCGGDAMRHGGVETVVDLREFAMVGITEVVSGLPRAYRASNRLLAEVGARAPQLAVLIDSPSLNLRLAKRLKQHHIPVVYFVSPQIWAWKKWRMKHIQERVDKMLCIFDFEEEIYRRAGVPVEYVGHPLVDSVQTSLTRDEFIARARLDPSLQTVALLPGSREKVVDFNLPTMLDCASLLASSRPVQFVVAAAPSLDSDWLESRISRRYAGRATLRTVTNLTHEALRYSDFAIVASGTATVVAALLECPMIVVYRVSPISWLMGKFMVDVPFYSMVNLLAKKAVVPEMIQTDFKVKPLAERCIHFLDNSAAREGMVRELRALRPRLGSGGAIGRAADAILGVLQPAAVAS